MKSVSGYKLKFCDALKTKLVRHYFTVKIPPNGFRDVTSPERKGQQWEVDFTFYDKETSSWKSGLLWSKQTITDCTGATLRIEFDRKPGTHEIEISLRKKMV